jgi:hypothetical protein
VFDDSNFQKLVEADNLTGEVISSNSFIIEVKGLEGITLGAQVLFEDGQRGLVREASGDHVIPWFTSGFHPVFAPDLRLVDATGAVVARDGTALNPDGRLGSHGICPTRQGVYID